MASYRNNSKIEHLNNSKCRKALFKKMQTTAQTDFNNNQVQEIWSKEKIGLIYKMINKFNSVSNLT